MSELVRYKNGTSHEEDPRIKAMLKRFADNWKDPAINVEFHAFAREITRQIMETYEFHDIVPYILDNKPIPRDTHKITFRNLGGFTATTVSSGGRRNQFRLDKTKTVVWIPDEFENATVELREDDIREATYGSVADIRNGLRDALIHKKMARTMEELHRICNMTDDKANWDGTDTASAGNANVIYNPGTRINKEAVNYAIRTVIARSGGVKSIVGRAEYLLQIADFPGFLANEATDPQKAELQRRGYIGTYRGANVVTIPEYRDEKSNRLVWDPYNVYVIGQGMAEVATLYDIEPITDFEAMRSVRLLGADHKFVVLSQDPQLKRGFRIQMQ